jgi:hypothetical protein
MSDKRMIDADELIRAVYDDNDKRTLITIIDSLAQSADALSQISSKNYGADGIGATHEEIDSLAQPVEPVKTEAIEAAKKLVGSYNHPHIGRPYLSSEIQAQLVELLDSFAVPVEDGAIEEVVKALNEMTFQCFHVLESTEKHIGFLHLERKKAMAMRDTLQAQLAERDAEIARLKGEYGKGMHEESKVPESPELAKARRAWEREYLQNDNDQDTALAARVYIAELEKRR